MIRVTFLRRYEYRLQPFGIVAAAAATALCTTAHIGEQMINDSIYLRSAYYRTGKKWWVGG